MNGTDLLLSPDPVGELMGALFAGSIFALVVLLAGVTLGYYILYRLIKAAVRNGVIEASQRTGGLGSGGSGFVNGYPPPQDVGPPAAPTYGGPNG